MKLKKNVKYNLIISEQEQTFRSLLDHFQCEDKIKMDMT